jgi:hypothetical protein
MDIAAEFMAVTINAFEANKRLADRAVDQVPDDKLHGTAPAGAADGIRLVLVKFGLGDPDGLLEIVVGQPRSG